MKKKSILSENYKRFFGQTLIVEGEQAFYDDGGWNQDTIEGLQSALSTAAALKYDLENNARGSQDAEQLLLELRELIDGLEYELNQLSEILDDDSVNEYGNPDEINQNPIHVDGFDSQYELYVDEEVEGEPQFEIIQDGRDVVASGIVGGAGVMSFTEVMSKEDLVNVIFDLMQGMNQ